MRFNNGEWAWAMIPTKYVCEAVKKCAVHLSANYGGKYKMPQKAENLFKMGYDPELDTSPQLDLDTDSYYLTVIGILQQMIALGKTSIITNLSLFVIPCSTP